MARFNRKFALKIFCLLMAFTANFAALAHHALSAEFIPEKTIVVKGILTKVEWVNPHLHLYLDVQKEASKIEHWTIEASSPNQLYRAGWRKELFKIGESLEIKGYPAKDGSNAMAVQVITFSDGKQLLGNGAAGDEKQLKAF